MLPFSFSSMTLRHVKWLFLPIYPLLREGFSVLPVPKVNGCSPCGSNVRDFFLVHFYELPRGKCLFFSASSSPCQPYRRRAGGEDGSGFPPVLLGQVWNMLDSAGLVSYYFALTQGQLTAVYISHANGIRKCALMIKI